MNKLSAYILIITAFSFINGCVSMPSPKTPLGTAAIKGDINAVKDLLAKGANACEKEGESGFTPLGWAYSGESLQGTNTCRNGTYRALMENAYETVRKGGQCPEAYYYSIAGGCNDIFKKLLEIGYNSNATFGKYYTALGVAAQKGQMEIAKVLIDKGADLDSAIYGLKQLAASQSPYLKYPANKKIYDDANLGVEMLYRLPPKQIEPKTAIATVTTSNPVFEKPVINSNIGPLPLAKKQSAQPAQRLIPSIQSNIGTMPVEKTKSAQPSQPLATPIQSDIGTLSLEKTIPNKNPLPGSVSATTESRTALVIGNSAYSSGPLKNPVNDAADMAAMLEKLGFSVTLNKDASLQEMDEAIEAFGNRLKRGGVGLFYYAGHGVQVNGTNYLLPIGAKINKEADVKYQAVDANKILDEMATANNGLNIVMLDACRDNPFTRSFRSAARGLAIVSSAPSGTFISYSTSPGNVARDGDGRNSPYTAALLQYLQAPGLTISDVFINVRTKVKKETGQVPWELSSLEGRFYFTPQDSRDKNLSDVPSYPPRTESDELVRQKNALEREKQELDRKKQDLERQKVLDAEREQLAADRRKLEAERQQMAMGKRPPVSAAGEIARDGRFIGYNDGTVLDTRTNLMWAAKDNGSEINWSGAKSYCENYRGGGYTDWRMPTQDELAGLYDDTKKYKTIHPGYVKLTELIQLTACCPWASESRASDAVFYSFSGGGRSWGVRYGDSFNRALPVRSAK